jgi:hypothetical protein
MNLSSDVFLVACLLPAMKSREDLYVRGRMSYMLYNSLNEIQDMYCNWFPDFKKIKIIASIANSLDSEIKSDSCAGFFTAGVDSFYTTLKHKKEIEKMIYVHGFDIKLNQVEYRGVVSSRISEISNNFKKEFIQIETNLREFTDDFCSWIIQFGAGLSSVAIALNFRTTYIPSSGDFIKMNIKSKWGSHPLIDHLWSTELVSIIHDSADILRFEKINKISDNEMALNHLRVCWESEKYNCGHCEKCLRTMIAMYAHNVLHKYKVFNGAGESELLKSINLFKIHEENDLIFAQENLGLLGDGIIKRTLKSVIDNYATV